MAFDVTLYACKSAQPLTGGATPIRFQGDEVQAPDHVSMSIGGFVGSSLLNERDLPLVMAVTPSTIPWPSIFALYRLFRDITATEATAGITLYRGFFVSPTTDCTNLQVYSNNGPTVGTLTLATEAVSTSGGNTYVQRLTNEASAPTGPVFAAYTTSGAALSLGATTAGEYRFVWVKLVLSAGASAKAYDSFNLTFIDGGGNSAVPHFFHTVQAGISTMTLSGGLDGQVVGPYGDTFVLTTANSSGTLIDAPSNTVSVYAAASFTDQTYHRGSYGSRVSGSFVGLAIKTATGTYRFQFKPPAPGHYFLTFDAGGEMQAYRNVEVSPVGG